MSNFLQKVFDKVDQLLSKQKKKKQYADCIVRNEKGELLLLQRSYQDDFQPGKWCLPGGKIEAGEVPEYAAARELLEETNLQTPLSLIQAVEREDSISVYFEGFVHSNDYAILDNNEHYRIEWVKIEDLAKYDLILDLKDVLTNKIGLPIYSTKLMELEIFDMNDLLKRNELVEKSFNENQLNTQEYFDLKSKIKQQARRVVEQAEKQGLIKRYRYE